MGVKVWHVFHYETIYVPMKPFIVASYASSHQPHVLIRYGHCGFLMYPLVAPPIGGSIPRSCYDDALGNDLAWPWTNPRLESTFQYLRCVPT